ncbi:MAG: histidine phosphatase family protein, partial [Microbacterium gubbeenense]
WSTYPDRNAPGSESSIELQERALAALEEIAEEAGADPVIAVAHGGLISTILRYASGGSLPREGEHVGNGSQQIVEVIGPDVRVIGYNGSPR